MTAQLLLWLGKHMPELIIAVILLGAVLWLMDYARSKERAKAEKQEKKADEKIDKTIAGNNTLDMASLLDWLLGKQNKAK